MIVRLILGDQLNYEHSWFKEESEDICYFMAEMRQETDYVRHHIQKVVAFFDSMRNFADCLKTQGKKVIYYTLDDDRNTQSLAGNLNQVIEKLEAKRFEFQLPDEYRLDEQLKVFCEGLTIETNVCDTEHFLTDRTNLANFFEGKKRYTMEFFYRYMRRRYNIMMLDEKEPKGGKWNFDHSNRKKWTGSPGIPHPKLFHKNVAHLVKMINEEQVKTIGTIDENDFNYPTTRAECLAVLDCFCKNLLVYFGDYQDAMHNEEKYLFHSRLSFAMNSKMLHPKEVVDAVILYWRKHQNEIDISQVEGFVRQVIGWREYMRGMYWMAMPAYLNL